MATDDTIADTVRQRRKQLRLSQAAAAAQAGISRRLWSEIELGQRRGSPDTLGKIDAVLGFPEGSLAALDVQPTNVELAAIKRELVAMINRLVTRDEIEQARLDVMRGQLGVMQAQLDQWERERHDGRAAGAEQR